MSKLSWFIFVWFLGFSTSEKNKQIEECKSIMECYAITPCFELSSDKILQLELGRETITDSCAAVVQLHVYSEHKSVMILQSFDNSVKKIVFVPREATDIQYECSKDDMGAGKAEETKSSSKIILKEVRTSTPDQPLRCEFLTTSKKQEVFGPGASTSSMTVEDTANTYTNKMFSNTVKFTERCNPSELIFSREEEDKNKYYDRVIYNRGELQCRDNNLKKEFRAPQKTKYEPITAFECTLNSKFKINSDIMTSSVLVRCSTDADYACDYDLKFKDGETELKYTKPNLTTSTKGSLKCPPTHKYLVVGHEKPTDKYDIKCKNHGRGVMKWTTSAGTWLTESGPEIYCTDKLSCKTVSSVAVKFGYLKDSFPACYKEGKLSITDDGEKFNDFYYEFKCDTSKGENQFNTTGGQRAITDKTEFKCSYPDRAEAKTAQNIKKVATISVFMVVGLIILVPLAIFLVFFVSFKLMEKRRKKKAEAAEYREYNMFVVNSEERFKVEVDAEAIKRAVLKPKEEKERGIVFQKRGKEEPSMFVDTNFDLFKKEGESTQIMPSLDDSMFVDQDLF